MKKSYSELVIKLTPFEIIGPENLTVVQKEWLEGMDSQMLVDWCDLPDILYSKEDGKFIGLSFAVSRTYRDFVELLVKNVADNRFRYLRIENDGNDRYAGFGSRDRLEMYWADAEDVGCELASMDRGAWLFNAAPVAANGSINPCGYSLILFDEIPQDYALQAISAVARNAS